MLWVDLVAEELPSLRLYASAALGSPARGDLAVEAALRRLLDEAVTDLPGRIVPFRLLDHEIRQNRAPPDDERAELLRRLAGFSAEEARLIVTWSDGTPLRSAG
jgi:hypothetical protein